MRPVWGALLCAAAAFAGGPPREEGDRALAEGRHADATRHYLEARDRGDVDGDLLFRLGNAYAGDGDVGRAVLSYERARLLAPRNGVVRDALDALRRGAGLEGDLDGGWRGFHRFMTVDEWTWLGLAAGGVLVAALLGWRRLSRAALARIAGAAVLLALPAATAVTKHALDRGRAIVVAAGKSDLRASPDRTAALAGTVRAGQVVETTGSREGFVLVKRPGAAAGWIERSAVEQLIP